MDKLRVSSAALLALLSLPAIAAALSSPAPEEILGKADAVRNPGESYLMTVEITSPQSSDRSVFEVAIRGNDKTLVKTIEPARDRGRNLLMLEQDMWAYIPNLKRAVRVGLNQRLTGQAANGDISRMRWRGDYTANLESETATEWVLFLTAVKKGLTYDKVRVWVRKDGFQPAKAQFLTLSGSPLKEASYEGYESIAGAVRPTEIHIRDAIRPDETSVIHVVEMSLKDFPESLFNQNNLK